MRNRLLFALLTLTLAATVHGQCTVALSHSGIVRVQSDEETLLTWDAVPGATGYLVQEVIEGINEPGPPDTMFGGPYTESRNYEMPAVLREFHVSHAVTYKIRFRYIVTALNRGDANWQPCSADVLFVIEPDQELATLAETRIVPFAGKTRGRNGADYATSLILAGTGLGPSRTDPEPPPRPDGSKNPTYDELPKLYQGRIFFRPLNTPASDTDPFIEYALGGEETLVFDDIMQSLGATGVGTIEVRPRAGHPAPLVDAIIENRMPNGNRVGVRVGGELARHHVGRGNSATVGIRNTQDTRLSFGIRTFGTGGRVYFERFSADGHLLETAERYVDGNTTVSWALQDLFLTPLMAGQRVVAGYSGFRLYGANGEQFGIPRGAMFFLTETGNDLDNPAVIYRDPLQDRTYQNGFDRFIVE
jgi:hypothetical protein